MTDKNRRSGRVVGEIVASNTENGLQMASLSLSAWRAELAQVRPCSTLAVSQVAEPRAARQAARRRWSQRTGYAHLQELCAA